MKRHIASLALVCLLAAPVGGCSLLTATTTSGSTVPATTRETVSKAIASTESLATIAAKGITTAAQKGLILKDSDTAKALNTALKGAGLALDAAESYAAAGLYAQAQEEVDNANAVISNVTAQTPQGS